jgi:hypothetical protein
VIAPSALTMEDERVLANPLRALFLLAAIGAGACAASPPPEPAATTPSVASAPASSSSPALAGPQAPAPTTAPPAASGTPEPPTAEPIVAGEPLGSPLSNAPATSTGPSGNNAVAAINAVRPKLRSCYQTAKGSGPDIAGMVSCGLRVTKEGKVASISVTRRDRLPTPLVDCIVKELKTATFGPTEEEVVIQIPVRFAVPGE